MEKVSAAIITFNEEKNIERCLKSLQGVVDEIVVVDSFSTDKTEEICLQYGTRFLKNPFKGHVEQKNYAVSQCTHTWVLSLDADEALSDRLKQSILEVKRNPQADGYSFNRATHFCGKHVRHSGWYPDVSLRFWNKTKGAWAGLNPHDKFYLQEGAVRKHIKGDLMHYSFHTFDELLQMTSRFSTISAKSKIANGKRSSLTKIILYPIWRFFRNYILYRGFLDGYNGYVICSISAFEVFSKYVKMKDLQDNKNN